MNVEQLNVILDTLPDPTFLVTRQGRYIQAFGGKDSQYYPNAKELIGHNIHNVVESEIANWAIAQIELALETKKLVIVEYELSKSDFNVLSDEGPDTAIWFEGRIQALDFQLNDEDVVLWVASNISNRHELEVKLKNMSDTDQLTGLFNRRKLEHDLELCFESLKRHAIPTSLLMFDVDNLKLMNDTLGHIAGDELIASVAEICLSELRKNDGAYRFGGDEFVIAMPATDSTQALQLAHRIHHRSLQSLSSYRMNELQATLSIGVTSMLASDSSYVDSLKRADQALYKAKHTGKNKIIIK
ncbi:MAG: GGDEF domain-containing protein [Oceanospirillales bacterium]|nr:MAG: GGDEF domain-containing protein [Oceanospirillales bacterium]